MFHKNTRGFCGTICDTMICKKCLKDNNANADYCSRCGSLLPLYIEHAYLPCPQPRNKGKRFVLAFIETLLLASALLLFVPPSAVSTASSSVMDLLNNAAISMYNPVYSSTPAPVSTQVSPYDTGQQASKSTNQLLSNTPSVVNSENQQKQKPNSGAATNIKVSKPTHIYLKGKTKRLASSHG